MGRAADPRGASTHHGTLTAQISMLLPPEHSMQRRFSCPKGPGPQGIVTGQLAAGRDSVLREAQFKGDQRGVVLSRALGDKLRP